MDNTDGYRAGPPGNKLPQTLDPAVQNAALGGQIEIQNRTARFFDQGGGPKTARQQNARRQIERCHLYSAFGIGPDRSQRFVGIAHRIDSAVRAVV